MGFDMFDLPQHCLLSWDTQLTAPASQQGCNQLGKLIVLRVEISTRTKFCRMDQLWMVDACGIDTSPPIVPCGLAICMAPLCLCSWVKHSCKQTLRQGSVRRRQCITRWWWKLLLKRMQLSRSSHHDQVIRCICVSILVSLHCTRWHFLGLRACLPSCHIPNHTHIRIIYYTLKKVTHLPNTNHHNSNSYKVWWRYGLGTPLETNLLISTSLSVLLSFRKNSSPSSVAAPGPWALASLEAPVFLKRWTVWMWDTPWGPPSRLTKMV